jgi:hypothetical protein
MKTPRSFVDELSQVKLADTFNPYSDHCPDHDLPDGASIRRQNLRVCLEAALDAKAETIWVARDLGYRGGRRTGMPLTDEAHLADASRLFGGVALERATKGPALVERTATVTWKLLSEINRPVFLWNVFPLHPHAADEHMTNRCHKKSERLLTWPFMLALLDMIKPRRLVAIGRDAGLALDGLETIVETVRHPSYGGQSDFISGIQRIYSLPQSPCSPSTGTLPFVEFA